MFIITKPIGPSDAAGLPTVETSARGINRDVKDLGLFPPILAACLQTNAIWTLIIARLHINRNLETGAAAT